MQLMADAVAVLGSRHGIMVDPIHKKCGIIRLDQFSFLPELTLRAGAVINGKEYILPLAPGGEDFMFLDQRISPCTTSLMGIHPESALKVKLTLATPFRPRDIEFSVTPVIGLRLEAESLLGHFRWTGKPLNLDEVEIFVEFSGKDMTVEDSGKASVDLLFSSHRKGPQENSASVPIPQRDRVVGLTGTKTGTRFSRKVKLTPGAGETLDLAWCSYQAEGLTIQGTLHPFKYSNWFKSLADVAAWAESHPTAVFDNARTVDALVARNTCGYAVNSLLANTLHSWLICTWFIQRGDRDWFSVWEGSCYFHSTVDVEYTQAPFYLAVWPELLGIELDFWPEYSKDGKLSIGERGEGTLFLSHDTGQVTHADKQMYPHEMEVEENANYIILSYAYWKRTGDTSRLRRNADTLRKYMEFIAACDTAGDGVPSHGVANTIDDASPAIQFGKQQIYLAVKAMVAYDTGAEMMQLLGDKATAKRFKKLAGVVRGIIARKGWRKDHFVTLLDKRGYGLVNPWTGEKFDWDTVPGWDAAHIYTVNGIAVLDMVGYKSGIDERRIATDLKVATQHCLTEYGCVHTDYVEAKVKASDKMAGLAGVSRNPGWISMNMLRDMAAFYRGIDLRNLAERYWNWQVVTNTQEPKIFFETFKGNNLCFYPRGVAVWGFFEALAGQVINKADAIDRAKPKFKQVSVPRLFDADWKKGKCKVTEN